MPSDYGLSFITNEDIFNHVKNTVENYRFSINLKEFNKNIVDPIKLTFDAKIYGKTMEEIWGDGVWLVIHDESNETIVGTK